MSLEPGARLGPYEIVALVGAGGMGEVYKARDTRLGRTVAIKVLPPGAAASPERRRRFEQEARAVSSLNHPHICTSHDIGRDGETDYLVMEFVQGETLAARLARGLLPRGQALEYASQMAQALSKAHAEGVVHRDLKPGNIMVTESGVKLLDFGLAKLNPAAEAGALSSLPTQESPLTGHGTIVGTLAYMAPEQLEGKEADARTDLFALGAVLYEMLSGRRAFEGTTQASVITAIMSADPPPLTSVEPLTPPALDRVVRKCLAKDPRARWQSAADLADELKWISSGSGVVPAPVAQAALPAPRRRAWMWMAPAGILLIAAIGATIWLTTRRPDTPAAVQGVRHTQLTFSGDVQQAALSPDGTAIAYAVGPLEGNQRLMLREVAGNETVEVWHGGRVSDVVWMPDGKQLVLAGRDQSTSSFQIHVVSRQGGTPRTVTGLGGAYLALSPDGRQIAAAYQNLPEFKVMALDGGPVQRVALPGLIGVSSLRWSHDGHRMAIAGLTVDSKGGVWTVNLDGTGFQLLYTFVSSADLLAAALAWSPADDAVYIQYAPTEGMSEMWRAPARQGTGHAPAVVLAGLPTAGSLTVSRNGDRVAHVRSATTANLWRLDLTTAGAPPVRLTNTTAALRRPRLSPDGREIVAMRGAELVKIPAGGGEPASFMRGGSASWSPDGRHLAYVADTDHGPRIFVADADGKNGTEVKDAIAGNNVVLWHADGRLMWQDGGSEHWLENYVLLDLASGKRESLVRGGVGWTIQASLSPDRKWFALYWNRPPTPGLWLVSSPWRVERVLAPELWPAGWSVDGRWVYAYRYQERQIVRVDAQTGKIEAMARFPEGGLEPAECGQTPDWRALVCSLVESKSDVWIVDHFDPAARK